MSPPKANALSGAAPAKSSLLAKAPVDADIRVCLDFIKGRCTRARCKFHHPEMSGYQQLSGAVQAQAGKQICEVWAMAGQCKFGAKCNKLHPVVFSQPTQPTFPLVVQPVSHGAISPASATVVPHHRQLTAAPTPPHSTPASPLQTLATPAPPSPLCAPLLGLQHEVSQIPAAKVDEEEEFEDLAQSIMKALESEEWEPNPVEPPVKRLTTDMPSPLSLASLFGMDRAFLDILGDLSFSAC
eukprot:GGOE01024238.1.p1 GENE.GGOE01024238.1~~GGOE01024238.1.p1  ORF type:complete len:252 (-),score=62.73 GGOE01024238.1:796-1518(-)